MKPLDFQSTAPQAAHTEKPIGSWFGCLGAGGSVHLCSPSSATVHVVRARGFLLPAIAAAPRGDLSCGLRKLMLLEVCAVHSAGHLLC